MDKQHKEIILRPSDVRYTQSTISHKFSDGTLIGRLLDDLVVGRCFVSAIKMIEVKLVDGLWYSADNRRLWVFKQLEFLGHCPFITVKVIRKIKWEKCTSENGGRDVSIRGGQPGGIWYAKAEEIRQNLKKDSSVLEGRKNKVKLAKSKLCCSKTVSSNDVQSSKCPVFDQKVLQFVRKNATKLQVDTSEEKLSKPDTIASLQVQKSKKKRKSKKRKEAVKKDEIPLESSMNEAHVMNDQHLENTPPKKSNDDTNEKIDVPIPKKKRRGKKRKLKQNTENELKTEPCKLLTSLSEAQGEGQRSTPLKTVTDFVNCRTDLNAKELVVVHQHVEANGHISQFETRFIDNGQYNATSTLGDGDEDESKDNFNYYNGEATCLDAYDDYMESDDDYCNDHDTIWLNSVYMHHRYGLNSRNSGICRNL